jgi:hypothetical protein
MGTVAERQMQPPLSHSPARLIVPKDKTQIRKDKKWNKFDIFSTIEPIPQPLLLTL